MTVTPLSLTFTPSNWSEPQTVTLTAIDDAIDNPANERTVTLSHKVSGGHYGNTENFDLKVTVTDDDDAPESSIALQRAQSAFLPRIGRTLSQQNVDAVTDRLKANRNPGFAGRFAGHALPKLAKTPPVQAAATDPGIESDHLEEIERFMTGTERTTKSVQMSGEEIVSGTSFALTSEDKKGASFALWGRGAYSAFKSREGGLNLDAEITSYMLGADWEQEGRLLGLMLSRNLGKGDYGFAGDKGRIETDLTALIPYLGWEFAARISGWISLGFGQGETTFSPIHSQSLTADTDWQMAGGGSTGVLGSVPFLGGAQLSWKADALWTRTASSLNSSRSDGTRLRLGIESRWTHNLAYGAQLSPRFELGQRYDGGDAETGYGLEIGGGVDWLDPVRGLEIGVEGRTLALHQDESLKSWGLAFSFAYDPRPQTKRGFRAQLSHDFGGAASGGVVALLNPDLFPEIRENANEGIWEAELTYGLRIQTNRRQDMVGSPYTRLKGGTSGFNQLRLGYRIEPDALNAIKMTLDLWAEPQIEANDADGGTAGLELQHQW